MIDDNKSFYERLEKQLSESSKWPSLYRFKFIVKSETKKIEQLKSVFADIKNVEISSRTSSNNKFTSFSLYLDECAFRKSSTSKGSITIFSYTNH